MDVNIKTLYYPGAGHDFEVIDHFHFTYGTARFYYTDYHPDVADLERIKCHLRGWEIADIQSLHPAYFGARSWRDFWHRNPKSHSFENPNRSSRFGHHMHLEHASGSTCQLTYLCTEGVESFRLIAQSFGLPDCVVLQDHGMGGNWTAFGGESELFDIAREWGLPPFIFHNEGTPVWPGYAAVTPFEGKFGQHQVPRSLKRLAIQQQNQPGT